jgi:D-glycero-D-manno-heptose 1,7-bisphosphate phosphatase
MNFQNIDALILAGGRGTRIKNITNKMPKPLIEFNKKPILDLILQHISKYNFNKIFILTGYRSKKIFKRYHNKFYNFVKIICFNERKRLGTWGAVYNVRKNIRQKFIIINGDTIFNAKLERLIKFKLKNEDMIMLLSNNHSYKENIKLTNLKLTKTKNIVFSRYSKFINSGQYYSSKKILKKKYANRTSLENEIIPELIREKKIKGIIENKKIIDIGTKKNLIYAKKNIPFITLKPAIFFDRDGVINYDFGHVFKFKDFKFKPGIIKTLKYLSKKNIYIFIVTNQAGIAKGKYSEEDFYNLHKKIKDYLISKKIFINDVKFSPYHPSAIIKKYKKKSGLRKPGNLMIEHLFSEWDIIRKRSFMIGDSFTDKLAAKKSNLYFEFPKKDIYNQIIKICNKFKI